MSAITAIPTNTANATDTAAVTPRRADRARLRRPAFTRLVAVETRKSFDTRAGKWLCVAIVALAVVASAAVATWAPPEAQTYGTYSSSVGVPMAIILPLLAILSVTSEWSQRSGLTTFTMVPSRVRVISSKAVSAALVGVVSMMVAMAIGALSTVVGSAIAGVDPDWNVTVGQFFAIVAANLGGVAMGFMLGLLLRSSAGAIVAFLVFYALVPTVSGTLAAFQQWWADLGPWLDFSYTLTLLFEGWPATGEGWAQLGTSSALWLWVPLAYALWSLRRAEVK